MIDAPPWVKTPLRQIAGEFEPDRLLDIVEEIVAAREPAISAFVNLEAPEERRLRMRAQSQSGPLAGLPFGVKDIFDTADLPTEYGSPIHVGHRPAADAAAVALLRAAGGGVFGKTVTTEFASFFPGPTRNPHSPAHSPGGSSSGSAAAVAAGMLPFTLGTQTGGSVIRPAAFCGVVGFKPSFDLVPTPGVKTFAWSLDTIGIFAPRVADAGFIAEVLTGRPFGVEKPSRLRIGMCRTPMFGDAENDMITGFEKANAMLSAAGFSVTPLNLPDLFAKAHRAHDVLNDREGAISLAYEWNNHRDLMSEGLRGILAAGLAYDPAIYDRARATMKATRLALTRIWADLDIIVAPSAPGPAPAGLDTTGSSVFNRLWTAMGVPCVNIPGLYAANDLPIGVQVIGPSLSDAKTIAAAEAVEAVLNPGGPRVAAMS